MRESGHSAHPSPRGRTPSRPCPGRQRRGSARQGVSVKLGIPMRRIMSKFILEQAISLDRQEQVSVGRWGT